MQGPEGSANIKLEAVNTLLYLLELFPVASQHPPFPMTLSWQGGCSSLQSNESFAETLSASVLRLCTSSFQKDTSSHTAELYKSSHILLASTEGKRLIANNGYHAGGSCATNVLRVTVHLQLHELYLSRNRPLLLNINQAFITACSDTASHVRDAAIEVLEALDKTEKAR